MAIKEGFRTALNLIRETSIESDTLYHRYIDQIYPDSDITKFANAILENPSVANEFFNVLIKRIVYTRIESKIYNNPLARLQGDRIPLGAIGQEIFINPIKARKFNVDDFAGLLAKYNADIKVQYTEVNSDLQYVVTVTRQKLRDAFTSWEKLNEFVDGLVSALYNGAYIDDFRLTKALVSSAYAGNNVVYKTITAVSSEATAKAFVKEARKLYKHFQFPSSDYNAWYKVGGYGNAVVTWSNPDDIVFLIRADVSTELDVDVLASAFNMSKTDLYGKVIEVDNFDVYDGDTKIYDGSDIVGIMADSSWFRIKEQERATDEFYNPNNRTWQFYLNMVKMYNYSLFANAVVFTTSAPTVKATAIEFVPGEAFEIEEGKSVIIDCIPTPFNATSTVTFTSGTSAVVSVEKISDRKVKITGVDANATAVTITASAESGAVTDTISVKCVAGS